MCVTAATSFDCKIQVDLQGEQVTGTNKMKILGIELDADCSFKSHIRTLRSRLRSKTWVLSRLRKRGLDCDKLVKVYKTLIRPSVEYLAPVWSSMITAEQAESLERQQIQALKNIYGPNISANKLRTRAGIDRLSERRRNLSLSFANKCLTNPRTAHWFVERPLPIYSRYHEETVRMDRHRCSPLNHLRKLLNNAG